MDFATFNAVMNIPGAGPLRDIAESVCMIRRTPPEAWVASPWGQLEAWRAVILEARLMAALR